MNCSLNIVYCHNKQIHMQILTFRVVKHCTERMIQLNFMIGLAMATNHTGYSNEPRYENSIITRTANKIAI